MAENSAHVTMGFTTETPKGVRPWAAVWSMLLGFFMLMVDSLIVSVANPTIEDELNTSLTATIWVTSAYMLAIAVPLLVTGRLGDRFGQKNVFMVGMALFTLSSLGCGLSNSITMLIAFRVAQGIGASLMTPQTQAIIVRLFPQGKRGSAMGLWGAVGGVAMLIAPLLGGYLVDNFGWKTIFLINVPIGIIGLILVTIFVPKLPTSRPRFDWLGMVLSGVGLFLIVFGLQEGSTDNWGKVSGPITIWELIGAGIVIMVLFVVWQLKGTESPLVPMRLFTHRDFALASAAISCAGFVTAAMTVPLLYYLQMARGFSAAHSALYMLPEAVFSGILSPIVGAKFVNRLGAKVICPIGMLIWGAGLFWFILLATPTQELFPWALFPAAVIGVGNAMVWTPLSVSAVRELPNADAGAGSSIYNTTRQIGSVIGSAAISTLMTSRITTHLTQGISALPPDVAKHVTISQNSDPSVWLATATAPEKAWFTHYFSPAMADSLWLPVIIALVGAVLAVFLNSKKRLQKKMQEKESAEK